MKIVNSSDAYNTKTIEYWDKWIGEGDMDYDFLKKHFQANHHVLILENTDKSIEGILLYNTVQCSNIYRIFLIAKPWYSIEKGIGKMFIDYFQEHFQGKFILSDDSQIPNYYEKLGFTKNNSCYYKFLLNNYRHPIYCKYFLK